MSAVGRLLVSSRPLSWVNTALPFAAAYYFGGGGFDPAMLAIALFFLVPYNLLMYGVNDVFDYESDLRNPRKGGIEGALLPPELHRPMLIWAAVIALPPALVIFFATTSNPAASAVFLVTMFAVIAYSIKGFRFKEIPFLDSVTSSTHFVGPMLFGLLLVTDMTADLWLATAAFFIWGAASHAFGAVQDVRADREANINSVATKLGARTAVRLAFLLYLIAAALLLMLPDRFAFAALAAAPYLVVTAREWKIEDANCERANRGWKLFLLWNFLAGAIIASLLIGPL